MIEDLKNFIKKTVMFFMSVFSLVILVNYFGDASNLYNKVEEKIAKLLINGSAVTNIENINERLLQKELINNANKKYNFVILGSSRLFQFSADNLKNDFTFNNSVSGASLEDYISIFQLYKENNNLPKKIIIEIVPWLFNENSNQRRWRSLRDYYNRYYGIQNNFITFAKMKLGKYNELKSLSYFQKSLPKLFYGKEVPHELKNGNYKNITKFPRGSISYPTQTINVSNRIVRERILNYLRGELYSLENFSNVSKDIIFNFKNFIKTLKSNNIDIEFFFMPYPSAVYKRISEDYDNVVKTENIVKRIAEDYNINCFGTFNPRGLKANQSHFFDGMHMNSKGIELFLENYF